MNEHPRESLPAFVLGALDADEAIQVSTHITTCSTCRAEIDQFQAVVDLLPFATLPQDPPAHVKRQLFARIAACEELEAPTRMQQRRAGRTPRVQPPWLAGLATGALALSLLLAFFVVDARNRMAALNAQLAQNQQLVEQMHGQLKQRQLTLTFLAATQTVAQPMVASEFAPGARATMYMQPGHNRALLVVHGLPPAGPGTTYQLWLTAKDQHVSAGTFSVGQDGMVELTIEAPASIDQYGQAIVTVEQAGGSSTPSDSVVLIAQL